MAFSLYRRESSDEAKHDVAWLHARTWRAGADGRREKCGDLLAERIR